jgi:xanthine/CO dehydrogenase XdhC/CoxF family maturation factor
MHEADVYGAVLAAAEAGRRVAIATVVATRGSVPRHAGSRMLVDPKGGLVGTIGGGCGESDVIAAAAEVVESGTPRLVRVELLDAVDSWSPAVCGGTMDVFIEPVLPATPRKTGDDAGDT